MKTTMCILAALGAFACGDDTDEADTGATDGSTDTTSTDGSAIDTGSTMNPEVPDLFDASLFTSTPTLVDCTLDDGTAVQCWELSFANYRDSSGPFCPETADEIGGVGIYDGETNPGFQVLKRELWEAMETDGYDILDDEGNVNINGGPGTGTCLEMALRDLTVTMLIPAEPVMLDAPNSIDVVEVFGLAVQDGMPLTGHPPSVVDGPPMPGAAGGGIPSLDPCGGHADPAGYWHWHFAPNATQSVLDSYGITEVGCTDIPQRTTGLVGFAKDGFPIYAPLEDGVVPSGLDECNGTFGITADYPQGVYHYYALNEVAPNLPTCIVGASVRNPLSVE